VALFALALASVVPGGSFGAERTTSPVSIANTVTHMVRRGETLGAILARYGVDSAEVHRWWSAARPTGDLSKLSVGHKIELGFTTERRLVRLGYGIDDDERLVVDRDPTRGSFRARVVEREVIVSPVGARGRVETSFYRAAQLAGIPEVVISEMVDILSVRLDFGSRVRPGDRFRVLYEGRQDDRGRQLKPGRVLAAEYYGARQSVAAYLYEDDSERTVYVDQAGQPMDDSLLRYPVQFTRITSTFSYSRFHPILKTRKPHLGVDFAAPTGTPIRAIGAGKVRWAAWKGSFGRHIEIDHGGKLVSAYSHLSRIHPSLVSGRQVERGQIIGWVGTSGRSTGPHLHFAIFENGRYVNPLSGRRSPVVAAVDHVRFAVQRESLGDQLRVMTTQHHPRRSAQPVALSSLTQAEHLHPAVLTF
jgi:murein DD-endopeptidase MepM/ murein hydrolase activator NlpD